jgi:NACHT domain
MDKKITQTGISDSTFGDNAGINISQEIHHEPDKLAETIGILVQAGGVVNIVTPNVGGAKEARREENSRTEKLEKMYRESIAWCKVRFLTVIRDEQKAAELANDFSLGKSPANLDLKGQGLFILTGDFGVGKTLIVQRIFQNAVKAALENSNAQIPIYLDTDTWRQDKPLRAIIENEADTLGDIKTQGAIIIIDELDKASVSLASEIAKQSYFLTEILQKTTIIITSRPIQHIEDNYEDNLIQIPPLSFEQAHYLIESISGQEVNPMRLRDLGASVGEVVTYPLFALLLGRYWREGNARPISTRAELLSNLVEDSLQQAEASQDVYKHLIKLAVRSIEFGNKAVPLADIDLSRSEQQALLDSRLVVRQSGGMTFPLSIFTQWFAYLALEENPSQIEKYLQDSEQLENWRYALIVAVGISSQTIIFKILTPIVEKYPSFAVEIIRSSLSNSLNSQRTALPPLQECGEQLRISMSAWVKGISRLANLIAPIRKDGTLCPVGVEIRHNTVLESGWYIGNENLADIQKLPIDFSNYPERENWRGFQGRRPIHQSAWAWLWTLNTLRASLVSEFNTASLPVNQGIMSREAAWRGAIAIFKHWQSRLLIDSTLSREKISVNFLEKSLSQIDEDYRTLPDFSIIYRKEQSFCLDCLRQEIKLMKEHNINDFSVSYTDVDSAYKKMRWNSDSDKISKLKKRVEEIYKAALDEYQNLSKMWFENLLSGMQVAGMLPAKLVGVFTPPMLPDNPSGSSPVFVWYLEPLPENSQNIVEIEFNEDVKNNPYETYCKQSNIIANQLRKLRPNASAWLNCNPHGSHLDISFFRSDAPVTVLVYSWLEKDLRSIGWIDSQTIQPVPYRSRVFE